MSVKLKDYPHKFFYCDPETNQRMLKYQPVGLMGGCMTIGENHYFYPRQPEQRFVDAYNYPLDERDTWVVTMPKCGTTWTQEMVWLIANDCDFEGAKTPLMPNRWDFLDMTKGLLMPDAAHRSMMWNIITHNTWKAPYAIWKMMWFFRSRSYSSPRFVKSHLPFSMLPPRLLDTCKVIYVARNPKDALVSYYHHHNLMPVQGFEGTFEDFFDLFLENKLLQLPFMPHLREAWDMRGHKNLLYIFFEEMKADLRGVIRRVGKFLGKDLTSEQVEKLYDHLKFDNFKKNPHVNFDIMKELGSFSKDGNFVRKGKTGDWKNHFTPEMDRRMNAWMEENLKGTDLSFTLELDKQD